MESKLTNVLKANPTAIVIRVNLQPAAGEGAKIQPPTFFADPGDSPYIEEERSVTTSVGHRIQVPAVILDTIQSQANRMEDSLLNGKNKGELDIPLISIDFSKEEKLNHIENVNTLTTAHRLADALFRDSELDGTPFYKTKYAEGWSKASNANMNRMFELCPTALIFGMWGGTKGPGVRGLKIQRCITSEIIALNTKQCKKGMSKGCPIGIKNTIKLQQNEDGSITEALGKGKTLKPSNVGLGQVANKVTTLMAGITCERIEESTVISLVAIRKYKFTSNSTPDLEVTTLAQTALTALALLSWFLKVEQGYDLRSGCLLCPTSKPQIEVVGPYNEVTIMDISKEEVKEVYDDCLKQLKAKGLEYVKDVTLTPSKTLLGISIKSQDTQEDVSSSN